MLNGADNDAVDRTVEFDWTCSVNGPQYTQEALVCSMQWRFPLDRLCGCVYVFHCDNQDRRVCVSFIFLLGLPVQSAAVPQGGSFSLPRMRSP